MRKVLFIAYHFPPIGGGGVQRTAKFVRYLPFSGYLPVVVTGPGPRNNRWTPTDQSIVDEIPANVAVQRIGSQPPQNSGVQDHLSRWFGLTPSFSRWWCRHTRNLAGEICSSDDIDLIFATMSPFESAAVASELAHKFAIPWVADLRDPWALDEMQVYTSGLHRRADLIRMRHFLSSASLIIMNTHEAAKRLHQAFPEFSKKKIVVITNGYDSNDFAVATPLRKGAKFRIVHTGYLHTDLGLDLRRKRHFYNLFGGTQKHVDILTRSHIYLLHALTRWCDTCPELADRVELILAGVSSAKDHRITYQSRVSHLVRFTGYLPHDDTVSLTRSADLLFLPMHNLPPGQRATIVPGKTYEYMASGRPILAAVPDGDAKRYISRCGTGFVCAPDDEVGMLRILQRVHQAWNDNTPIAVQDEVFVRQFERQKLAQELADSFDRLLSKTAATY